MIFNWCFCIPDKAGFGNNFTTVDNKSTAQNVEGIIVSAMFKSLITRCASTTHELHSPENLVRCSPPLPTRVLCLCSEIKFSCSGYEKEKLMSESLCFKVKISIFPVSPVIHGGTSETQFSSMLLIILPANWFIFFSVSEVPCGWCNSCKVLWALQKGDARAQHVSSWNIKERYTKHLLKQYLL